MFKKPKTEVKLKIPQESFPLGSKFEGTITVDSKEEFDATEIRAELRCIEKRRREEWVYNERLRQNVRRTYWDSIIHLSEDLKASGSMHIVPGLRKTFPITVNIPVGGLATLDSMDVNVTWLIKGVVAVNDRPDATSETYELQVFRESARIVKEVKMLPCDYCKSMMPSTSSACPICGAPRKS